MKQKSLHLYVGVSVCLMLISWWFAWLAAPEDGFQGTVYKILFVHVPCATVALAVSGIGLLITSVIGIAKKSTKALQAQKAWSEVALVFTFMTLLTGSLWGKPTWGTYWTWDARLTTTLILALTLAAYQLIYSATRDHPQRVIICSVLTLMICVDIPIIYKSVEWWRTLHQEATLIAERGKTMDPEMLQFLLLSVCATTFASIGLWSLRWIAISKHDKVVATLLSQDS